MQRLSLVPRLAPVSLLLLTTFAISSHAAESVPDNSRFYLQGNIGYGTNLMEGFDDSKGVYGITAGMPLDAIWALESDFHYWSSSVDVAASGEQAAAELEVYALDVAIKAGYAFTPMMRGFVKAGYSYLHGKADVDYSGSAGAISASGSDSEFRPVVGIGLQADYGRYFTTLAYNHFFVDDPYQISAVSIGFGYKF